jgi:hypothetical protein
MAVIISAQDGEATKIDVSEVAEHRPQTPQTSGQQHGQSGSQQIR